MIKKIKLAFKDLEKELAIISSYIGLHFFTI